MRLVYRAAAVAAIIALGTVSTIAARPALAGDLVSYQSTGWRYQQVTAGDPLEGTFHDTDFVDSAWPLGQGAFGSTGAGCPLEPTIATTWDANTNMLLRRHFIADPAIPVILHFAVDNDVNIWVNGTPVTFQAHDGCAALDDFSVDVTANAVLGDNVVAIQAIDRGVVSYFDMRIEGDAPVPTLARSWGALKTIYR